MRSSRSPTHRRRRTSTLRKNDDAVRGEFIALATPPPTRSP
jgi:hypothetical protein